MIEIETLDYVKKFAVDEFKAEIRNRTKGMSDKFGEIEKILTNEGIAGNEQVVEILLEETLYLIKILKKRGLTE